MFPGDGLEGLEVLGRDPDRLLDETVAAFQASWPDPGTGEAGDAPGKPYEPVLAEEERLELRRAWLAAVRPAGAPP